MRSADCVVACAGRASTDTAVAAAVADAVCVHTTPGLTVERAGPVGFYVQAGAMVDGGLRLADIAPGNRAAVFERHPRGAGFKRELTSVIAAEVRAVPEGRFALFSRLGFQLAAPHRTATAEPRRRLTRRGRRAGSLTARAA